MTSSLKNSGTNLECDALIRLAHPNLYQENTFRITGLPTDATEKEIKKHADKLKMMEELGYGQGANSAAFALNPPPSVDQIREAMQRLKEPEHRLVDEFFWFWPQKFGESAKDPAIQAILSGDSEKAYEIWVQLEKSSEGDCVARHNIAVMFHLVALDWTLYHIASEVDKEREEKIKGYWKESFSRWEKIAGDDRVWDSVKERIRTLDDPRLTTGFVRRMRASFPEALDKINAEVALQFAEQGRTDWAKIHIDFMNETHQGLDDVEKTAALVLEPTRNRVLQHIQSTKEECKKKPEKGVELARKLIEQCLPLQSLFEMFHGENSHHKTELFDEVASAIVDCAVGYQAKTSDDEAFVALLKESLPFATGMDVRQRIQRNIAIGEKNTRSKTLEPLYAELKKIQESKESASVRFRQIERQLMPRLLALAETGANQKALIAEFSDALAMVLRGISIDAHNDVLNHFDSVAVDAILLALKLVHDAELKKKIEKDSFFIREKHNNRRKFIWLSLAIGVIVSAFLVPWFAAAGVAFTVFMGGVLSLLFLKEDLFSDYNKKAIYYFFRLVAIGLLVLLVIATLSSTRFFSDEETLAKASPYHQLVQRYTIAQDLGITHGQDFKSWSIRKQNETDDPLYQHGADNNPLKELSYAIDRMINATGLDRAGEAAGGGVLGLFGDTAGDWGASFGRRLPRMVVDLIPLILLGVLPWGLAGSVLLSASKAYTITNLPWIFLIIIGGIVIFWIVKITNRENGFKI